VLSWYEADLVRDNIGSHVLVVQDEEERKGEGVGHGDKPPIKVLHGCSKGDHSYVPEDTRLGSCMPFHGC
jgi:hypothetical protein